MHRVIEDVRIGSHIQPYGIITVKFNKYKNKCKYTNGTEMKRTVIKKKFYF